MKNHALVLLSGGLDSVYNLFAANEKWPGQVAALHFDYGQRAKRQEFHAAQYFAQKLSVDLQCVDVTSIFAGGQSALTNTTQVLPLDVAIESQADSEVSAAQVWVPNRNGVFLNIAAAWAEARQIPLIIPGFNREEAQTFPDNSPEFIQQMNLSLDYSTKKQVQVVCFSQSLDKIEIVAECRRLGVDLSQVWSCYEDRARPCGQCESCLRFQRALQANS